MTVRLIAVTLKMVLFRETIPGTLEIGSGVTMLSGGEDERNWSQRYKSNLHKLASGDLLQEG